MSNQESGQSKAREDNDQKNRTPKSGERNLEKGSFGLFSFPENPERVTQV